MCFSVYDATEETFHVSAEGGIGVTSRGYQSYFSRLPNSFVSIRSESCVSQNSPMLVALRNGQGQSI